MDDVELIKQLYEEMYTAMIRKNRKELERVHDADFVLTHMTGLRQDRQTYINGIMDGTLNYFSAKTEALDIHVDGSCAAVTGKSLVRAAVFGGRENTWRLRLDFDLVKKPDGWKFVSAKASVW